MRTAPRPLHARGLAETPIELALRLVAFMLDVPVDAIRATTRSRAEAAFARQLVMYLAHVGFGYSLSEVGEALGRDRTTVSHACHRVEDLRDDPQIEETLAALETALQVRCDRRLRRCGRPRHDAALACR